MPQSNGNSARTIRGITRYARPGKPWTFLFKEDAADLEQVRQWRPHGAIAYAATQEHMDELFTLGCPIVYVSDRFHRPGAANVAVDSVIAGQLAARHLMERGYRHFGFVGEPSVSVCRRRREGFETTLAEAGFTCRTHEINLKGSRRDKHLAALAEDTLTWLAALPRPTGLLAWRDLAALPLAEACRRAGLAVPHDVAILGIDNDEAFCEMAYPTLSSVNMPFERVGYRATELLDGLMHGQPVPEQPLRIPPQNIVVRQSTDGLAVDDPLVIRAIDFIHARTCQAITVETVLRETNVSRRVLENRFRKAIGRTPLEQIHRSRVELAKRYLNRGDMTLQQIARASGFGSVKRLSAVFRKYVGESPADYRNGT